MASDVVWGGRTGPFPLHIDEGVFAPTTTSRELSDQLRIEPGEVVVDVGSGSGVLTFIAARLGARKAFGTDPNRAAVACARENAQRLGLAGAVEFRNATLFEKLDDARDADVVIGDVSGIPDELARSSGWFPGGFSGGPTGAEVPVAMLRQAREFLKAGARLYLPTGTLQAEKTILDAARSVFKSVIQLSERTVPLPPSLAESAAAKALMESGVISLVRRGSRYLWQMRIWECTL